MGRGCTEPGGPPGAAGSPRGAATGDRRRRRGTRASSGHSPGGSGSRLRRDGHGEACPATGRARARPGGSFPERAGRSGATLVVRHAAPSGTRAPPAEPAPGSRNGTGAGPLPVPATERPPAVSGLVDGDHRDVRRDCPPAGHARDRSWRGRRITVPGAVTGAGGRTPFADSRAMDRLPARIGREPAGRECTRAGAGSGCVRGRGAPGAGGPRRRGSPHARVFSADGREPADGRRVQRRLNREAEA